MTDKRERVVKHFKMFEVNFVAYHEGGTNIVVVKPESDRTYIDSLGRTINTKSILGKSTCGPNDKFSLTLGISIAASRCLDIILDRFNNDVLKKNVNFACKLKEFVAARKRKDKGNVDANTP